MNVKNLDSPSYSCFIPSIMSANCKVADTLKIHGQCVEFPGLLELTLHKTSGSF